MSELRFEGRVAIVTGAGGGLGRSHALALAARGAAVVVNDLGVGLDGSGASASAAERVVAEIAAAGGTALAEHSSVATPEGGAAMVQAALDAFGRVDIVVNNAGILRDKTFHNLSADDWDAVLNVHLRGSFNVTRAAWPHLREQRYGRVICTTSVAGYLGNFGQANYSAAKGALISFTKTLAAEGARSNILANVIAPGAATRMTEPLLTPERKELMDPARVSPVVLWLAHEDCALTGEVLSVGAGHVSRVYVGETRGIVKLDLSPEDVRDQWDAIASNEGAIEVRTIDDEFALMFGQG